MKRWLILSLLLLLLLSGCTIPSSRSPLKPAMVYNISPCFSNATNNALLYFINDTTLHIIQTHVYVCCSNITIKMEAKNDTIALYEENVGEMCKCLCPFKADIYLYNISGYKNVEIYGIKFRDIYGYELLHNLSLKEESAECKDDGDCVHMLSCCHQKAMPCVSKYKLPPEKIECRHVFCTMECRPCVACKCINGKCVSEKVGGCC